MHRLTSLRKLSFSATAWALIALTAVTLGPLVANPVASGATTTTTVSPSLPIVSDGAGRGYIYGVSCPSATTCVAVGDDATNQSVTTSGTLSGGVWTWTTEVAVTSDSSGRGYLYAVSCPSATNCVAVGYDGNHQSVTTSGTLSGGTWTWSPEVAITPDSSGRGYLYGVSCASATNCVAVGYDGNEQPVTTTGTYSGGTWTWSPEVAITSDSSGYGYLYGVSCATATNCVAVGYDNNDQPVTSTGTLVGSTWTWSTEAPAASDSSGRGYLYAVSCANATTCVAVGYDRNDQAVTTTGTYSGGTWTWGAEAPAASDSTGYGYLHGVSCASATTCVAVGHDGSDQGIYNVITVPGSTSLAPPLLTSFAATSGYGSLSLSWNASAGATSYVCTLLYGFNLPSSFTVVTTSTSCYFAGLDPNTAYGIAVVAQNSSGTSSSVEAFAVTYPSANAKRHSIICISTHPPRRVRRVTAVNPRCPSGFAPRH